MKPIMICCGVLLLAGLSTAQEAPIQFYSHEDIVKPSMNAQYVNFLKKVNEAYKKHNVQMSWNTFYADGFSYIHFSPMNGFDIAGVHKSFADLEATMGKEAFAELWEEKGKYIDSHNEFVSSYLTQYSYLAPGEEDNYRHMMFWVPMPGHEAEAHEIAKAWIELHKSKNAPNGYETFQVAFGGEPAWVIVSWGKDEIDYLTKSQRTNELFGEEGASLWARTLAITQKVHNRNGWYLPELSYHYKPASAAK